MKKTVLVTGASRGIGCEIARAFHGAGYNVAINYNMSADSANALMCELSGSLAVRADVSDEQAVIKMITDIREAFGSIDVLVNNAGVSSFGLIDEIKTDEWDRVFSVNMRGTFLCTKHTVRDMINKKNGSIINISSIWGVSGASCESLYSASKGAVAAFTKAAAKELGPSNVRVNAIAPGFIDTDMNKDIGEEARKIFIGDTPLGRTGSASEVAQLALFLASSGASYITGQIIGCDGGSFI